METFGEKLRTLRKNAGLTQKQLAERIWVTKAAVSNYELYGHMPSLETLVRIARVFHVTTDYLLGCETSRQIFEADGLTEEDMQVIQNMIDLLKKKNISQK